MSLAPGVRPGLAFRSVLHGAFCRTSAADIHVEKAGLHHFRHAELASQMFGLPRCVASDFGPSHPCALKVCTEAVKYLYRRNLNLGLHWGFLTIV